MTEQTMVPVLVRAGRWTGEAPRCERCGAPTRVKTVGPVLCRTHAKWRFGARGGAIWKAARLVREKGRAG